MICFSLFQNQSLLNLLENALIFNEIFQICIKLEFTLMYEIYLFSSIVLLIKQLTSAQVDLFQFVHDCICEFLLPVFEELQTIDDITMRYVYYLLPQVCWQVIHKLFTIVDILLCHIVFDVPLYSVVQIILQFLFLLEVPEQF